MFAAASGARLAHRHEKKPPAAPIRKQASSSQIEGLHVEYKVFQLQRERKRLEALNNGPNIHGRHHRDISYLDLNSRISKLDIEGDGLSNRNESIDHNSSSARNQGKAAWQDRDGAFAFDHNHADSMDITSDGASTHRSKQKEAHRRWVKRNRIHDSSVGDCSSDEDDLYGPYGVQNAAANALLYIGLGTMAVGMIIAFVGTGEKGFKTMELRLIGPSLIGVGVVIVILRIMLCVCPAACLKHKHKHKHKHKNSTNKQNSEDAPTANLLKPDESKIVSIATTAVEPTENIAATVSFLESERVLELKPLDSPLLKPPRTPSDLSVTSLTNGLLNLSDSEKAGGVERHLTTATKPLNKFEATRVPKNNAKSELLLSPTMLAEVSEDS